MSDNENKVTPSEPATSERELAERIYEYIDSPPGPCPLVETEHIAHLIHAHNDRQREVLLDVRNKLAEIASLSRTFMVSSMPHEINRKCALEAIEQLNQLLK